MPVNRKYPLRELIPACEAYRKVKGRRLTFEYILIAGINDRAQDGERLGILARKLDAMVNLIPYNEVQGLTWRRPSEAAQEAFLRIVERSRGSRSPYGGRRGTTLTPRADSFGCRLNGELESWLMVGIFRSNLFPPILPRAVGGGWTQDSSGDCAAGWPEPG